jgi:hypothetical protein
MEAHKGGRLMTGDDLFEIERNFWTGDAEFYRRNLDEKCLVVFTEMSGLMARNDIAATIKDASRWQKLHIDDKSSLALSDDVALLSYRANAMRDKGETYQALVSSAYVRRGGQWKMAFHQQTPLGGK